MTGANTRVGGISMTHRSLPSMRDVAEHAQVSLATVDRVLHGRPGVREPTIARVMKAAKALGYMTETESANAGQTQTKSLKLMFLLPNSDNAFLRMLQDMVGYSQDRWLSVQVSCQVECIEGFNPSALAEALLRHGRRFDGVVFFGLDHPLVRDAVNTLTAEGVPIVTLVSDISQSPCVGFVGMDGHTAGRTAADLMARFMGVRGKQNGGKVAMIAGSLNYRAHVERQTGFLHLLRDQYKNVEVVGLREGRDNAETNYHHVRTLFERHPDITGIYCLGGGAQGIAKALKERRLDHRVTFIGHGLTPDTRALLIDGSMDASLYQTPHNLIGNCVRIFANLRDGLQASVGVEPVQVKVMFRENLP